MPSSRERVKKRCDKCHAIGMHAIRERRCKRLERNAMGRSGFACWGHLQRVVRTKKPKSAPLPPVPAGVGLGHVLSEEYEAAMVDMRGDQHRDRAKKHVEKIKATLKEKSEKIRSIKRQIKVWESKLQRQTKLARMTNDELEAIRQRALTAAQVRVVRSRLRGRKPAKEANP